MPLFNPAHRPALAPQDAVAAVHDFLQRCQHWAAEIEIPKRLQRVEEDLQTEDAAKLHAWVAYLRFTEHALGELEAGKLDHWFQEG